MQQVINNKRSLNSLLLFLISFQHYLDQAWWSMTHSRLGQPGPSQLIGLFGRDIYNGQVEALLNGPQQWAGKWLMFPGWTQSGWACLSSSNVFSWRGTLRWIRVSAHLSCNKTSSLHDHQQYYLFRHTSHCTNQSTNDSNSNKNQWEAGSADHIHKTYSSMCNASTYTYIELFTSLWFFPHIPTVTDL